MNNVLFINKPAGMTSFDVCFRLRKVLGTKKIGHTGTLDPGARGVMVILFDKATKAGQFLVSDRKTYETRIRLGVMTDTLDRDGNILETRGFVLPDRQTIIKVLDSFKGKQKQEVPLTSAVSVNGRRLYEYQRKGIEVDIPVRDIEVYDIGLLDIHADGFSFHASVSSGTYIRSLARDIAQKLGTIGIVNELVRTAVDEIRIEDCDEFDDVLSGEYHCHDLYELFEKRFAIVEYEDEQAIRNGKAVRIPSTADRVVIAKGREVLAVYEKSDDHYRCLRGLW